jgi:hypothetical protein
MNQNWVLVAAIIAILAVPFGLALFEDATRDPVDEPADEFEPELAGYEAEPEPELDDDVVKWERADPLDLSFIDQYLDPSEPGLGPELDALVSFDRPPTDRARVFEARFNAAHVNQSLSIAIEPAPQLYTTGPVASVTFRFPGNQDVYRALVKRWGGPVAPSQFGQPCSVWHSQTGLTRAVLDLDADPWRLQFSRYQSFEELFMPRSDGSLGLEPIALVGASIDDVRARHGEILVTTGTSDPTYTLLVEPSTFSREPTLPIELVTYAGDITEISATIDMACDRRAVSRARAFLDRTFGPVSAEAELGEGREIRYQSRPDLSVLTYPDRVIMVRRSVAR